VWSALLEEVGNVGPQLNADELFLSVFQLGEILENR